MPNLEKVAIHWIDAAPSVFPNLHALIVGWSEPSCFRCGWLAPMPQMSPAKPWQTATGWLERAHLQDHALDGRDTPENLVPLCPLCHSVMPSFADPALAIDWVKRGQPLTCDWWWQWATDGRYGGDGFTAYPGFSAFRRFYLHMSDGYRQMQAGTLQAVDPGLVAAVGANPVAGAGYAPGAAAGVVTPCATPAATKTLHGTAGRGGARQAVARRGMEHH